MLQSELTYSLDPAYLDDLATKYHLDYLKAEPFPHIIIDDFLPTEILDKILEEFPRPEAIDWQSFKNKSEKKLASTSELQMGETIRLLLYQLNSSTFIDISKRLFGGILTN
jgi:hypothetical protein